MRRWPQREPTLTPKKIGPARKLADNLPDPIEPWLDSGGLGYYVAFPEPFVPQEGATQLLAYCYIPAGFQAFVKQLHVGPFAPSVLTHPWTTSGVVNGMGSWQDFEDTAGLAFQQRAPEVAGYYRTPFAWESFFQGQDTPPAWRWSLRMSQGDAITDRAKQDPFDTADKSSWRWIPNIPVPTDPAYLGGLPGRSVGPRFDAQRMQVVPEHALDVHIPIPENTTVSLWAQWTQNRIENGAFGYDLNGRIEYSDDFFYPLLPSYGQLVGYMQSLNAPAHDRDELNAVALNLLFGWGG